MDGVTYCQECGTWMEEEGRGLWCTNTHCGYSRKIKVAKDDCAKQYDDVKKAKYYIEVKIKLLKKEVKDD